jgi:hypothetical protein
MTRRPRTRGRFLSPCGQIAAAFATVALLILLERLFLS